MTERNKSMDCSLVDWSKPEESPQPKIGSKRKSGKLKRAQKELKKCGFEEAVIKSYSCAWQKDILVQGHLHLSEGWICFYSSILGWETKTSIKLKDITSISKQRTVLVFPNAILVEVGDKKYGFTSFVYRDRAFKVMQFIWHNSQLQEPSTGEALRDQLSHLTGQQRHSPIGGRSKSSSLSFTGDSSDVECSSMVSSTSPAHSPSHSLSTPVADDIPALSSSSAPQVTMSGSDWDASTELVDGGIMCRDKHLVQFPASTCSSSESSVGSSRSLHDENGNDDDVSTETSSQQSFYMNKRTLNRSPSLLTLKPYIMSEASAAVQPEPILGGSPNFLHHWKRTLSVATVWQIVVTTAKPQHFAHICSPSRLINMLIILFIVLLLLSMVSMMCQLSKVEPALQPYLGWQPWCSKC